MSRKEGREAEPKATSAALKFDATKTDILEFVRESERLTQLAEVDCNFLESLWKLRFHVESRDAADHKIEFLLFVSRLVLDTTGRMSRGGGVNT